MSGRMMVAAMILFVGACGDGVTDSNPKQLIRLRGNVTSAATQAPIQGAQVSLVLSGFFVPDRVLMSTTTAAAGNYSVEYSRTVSAINDGCPPLFLHVQAAGFQNTTSGLVGCIEELQTFDFAL